MARFRKKPVVIEAVQWFKNGDHPNDECVEINPPNLAITEGKIVRYFRDSFVVPDKICSHCKVQMHDHGWIDTLEAGHRVCPGDWIITGISGERYPVKDDIFRMTYDVVDPDGCESDGS